MSALHFGQHRMYGLILCAALATSNASPAFAKEAHRFEIASGDAVRAIQDFGTQSGVQILVSADVLDGKRLQGVNGVLSTDDGLKALLEGTGLTHRYVGERTVALVTASEETASSSATAPVEPQLEEVVVSAQKRTERLQDVPVPVAVLEGAALAETNQVQLRDYYASVPGFNVAPNYVATQNLSIRGVTTGGLENPTVGVVVDDAPFGSSTNQGNSVPDFDPGDLARIEVLRGPQGSLYGANSMGGLLKFVTIDPSTQALSGRLTLGTSGIAHGNGSGYNAHGAINVPISDTFAIRGTAFSRRDPGYLDNAMLGREDTNDGEAYGTRWSSLWRPGQDTSLKLSALYQHFEWDSLDEAVIAPGLGELEHNYIPNAGRGSRKVQAYGATFSTRLGNVELTSVTGYNVNDVDLSLDISFAFGGLTLPDYGVDTVLYRSPSESTKKFSQEFRFAGPLGTRVEWLAGAFYTHEDGNYWAVADAQDASGAFLGRYYDSRSGREFEEYAAFANLTFQITDRFDLQVGGRSSRNEVVDPERIVTGGYARDLLGGDPNIAQRLEVTDNVFTYLVTPRLKLSPELMVYARFASGYRPGTPNPIRPGAPRQSSPDTTENYEIGIKGDFLDRRLTLDASLYYIDWQDIQYQARDLATQSPYYDNGWTAKSEGVELALASRPLTGLTVDASMAYNIAELTEDFPATAQSVGAQGDRLPNTPRFSAHLAIEQEFPLWVGASGFVGASASHVGERLGPFTRAPGTRQIFPSYTRTDLRAGVRLDSWTFTGFVNNVTDERGLLDGGLGYFYAPARIYIKPRTFGLNATKSF